MRPSYSHLRPDTVKMTRDAQNLLLISTGMLLFAFLSSLFFYLFTPSGNLVSALVCLLGFCFQSWFFRIPALIRRRLKW